LKALQARANANFAALSAWVIKSNWVDFLADDASYRSSTSVCLKITDPAFAKLDGDARYAMVQKIANALEAEGVAFDVAGHRNAPAGLRIWCGATVEAAEIEALTPWLDWAWAQVKG
jgi:phosphoserine aminotransferase